MRFHKKFARQVGAVSGDPLLGSDTAPSAATQVSADNCLNARFKDIDGWPCHRVAIAYKYTGGGTPLPLNADLYIWDDLLEDWFIVATGVVLTPSTITFVEMPGLQPPPAKPGEGATAGSIEAVLVVNANAVDDNGVYEFAMAPDQTTPGAETPMEYHTASGVNGTESIPAGRRVVGITAFAANGVATATVQVGADAAAPVPDGKTLKLAPPMDSLRGEVDIVFTDTAGYVVETVE